MRSFPRRGLAFLLLAFALFPLGCTRKNKTGSGGAEAGANPVALRIELSEPQASLVNQEIGGQKTLVFNWKVKYRVTQGRPDPGAWYTCQVRDGTGVSLVQKQGRELAAEVEFAKDGNLIIKEAPKTLTMAVYQGTAPNVLGPVVSNEITCDVKSLQ